MVPVVKAGDDYFLVPHFGRAPSFAVVEVEGGSCSVMEVLETVRSSRAREGARLIEDLAKRRVDAISTLGIGYGAFYRLKGLGVRTYHAAPSPGSGTHPSRSHRGATSGKAEEASERGRLSVGRPRTSRQRWKGA